MENFSEHKLDVLLITETWLQNTIEDDTWLQASEFCQDDHEISNINRQDKRGEGTALLYSPKYKIKTVAHTKYSSFEMAYTNWINTLHTTWHLLSTIWNATMNYKQYFHR